MEERGGLLQIQRIHGGVESGMNGLLFAEPHGVDLSQGHRTVRARGAAEARVMEVSARAHIHARYVASTAITVA